MDDDIVEVSCWHYIERISLTALITSEKKTFAMYEDLTCVTMDCKSVSDFSILV